MFQLETIQQLLQLPTHKWLQEHVLLRIRGPKMLIMVGKPVEGIIYTNMSPIAVLFVETVHVG